ncbi:MAG: 5-(carboxyamino)imidazole ribonucleotide mutase [Christensenellales bacterium]|jgi:5-(carboxyamino)imidazole ribonucleotide mutase
MPKAAIVMGSDSDLEALKPAFRILKEFDIEVQARVISAHRTPDAAHAFSKHAADDGIEVIIAAAGKAAHLAGVLAAYTPLPVIGIPIQSSTMDGLDSLLSTVQMPAGIPVATVAINGAQNAALLAVQILSLRYGYLQQKMIEYKKNMANDVIKKDKKLQNGLQALLDD